MILYAIPIFVGAFLLFLVQPIIAKQILPWFGGSAAVWATCMVFFQMALLVGYGYADVTTRRLTPRRQAAVHVVLLVLSLLALPILASLLALLSYPVLIEPWVSTVTQSIVWSACYVLFALLCGYAAVT